MSLSLRPQCAACPWHDMNAMRTLWPTLVEYAAEHPDGFVCHTRCGPCDGPRHAGVYPPATEVV